MIEQPFILHQIYKRSEIHKLYGGQEQGGVSTPKNYPFIFIFSNNQGKNHGYKDEWLGNVYAYTGHGGIGDMQFISGNKQIRDHKINNKRIFLFIEAYRSHYLFEGEFELDNYNYFPSHDNNNHIREAIKFFLKRVEDQISLGDEFRAAGEPAFSAPPNSTERSGLVLSRVGQGAYRDGILYKWDHKCAVTGYNDNRILIASHIHPWKDATDDERLDIQNGILLSPTYDALFDRHLISFENSGKIILSDSINNNNLHLIGVTGKEKISSLTNGNMNYLEKHRSLLK